MVRAVAWTDDSSDRLLTEVRDTGFLPDASDQTDAVLLRFADAETRTMIAKAVDKSRGEHWYRYEDQALVPGTKLYRIPRRCLARSIRGVTVIDTAGNTLPPLVQKDTVELQALYRTADSGTPRFWSFEDDFVRLGVVPASSGWTLRIHYVVRPSSLCLLGSYTAVSRIGSAGSTTALALYTGDAATFASFGKYALYDIVRGVEPYPVVYQDRYAPADYINPGPNITLDAATPVVVADFTLQGFATYTGIAGREAMWWVPRDTSPFPMIPKVMWNALVHGTVAAALEAVRDPGAAQMRGVQVAMLNDALALMSPRDQRNTQRIVSRGALRSGRGGHRGGFRE